MAFPLINPTPSWPEAALGTIEFRDPNTDLYINSYPTADDADARTNANDNPLTLTAEGEAVSGLFLEDGVSYKVEVKTELGASHWVHDDVRSPSSAFSSVATDEENLALVTPTNFQYLPGDPRRYDGVGDGAIDDTIACQDSVKANKLTTIHSGLTFLVSSLTMPVGASITGTGTIKKSDTGILFSYTLGMIDASITDITVDADDLSGFLYDNGNLGSTNFRLQDVTHKNLAAALFNLDGGLPNVNVKITDNFFIGSDSFKVQIGGVESVYGYQFSDNYGYRCSGPSITNGELLDGTTYPSPGNIVITDNIFRMPVNAVADSPKISMILVRSNVFSETQQDITITHNQVSGGKLGINVAEQGTGSGVSRIIISDNICKNQLNGGITVGKADSATTEAIVTDNIVTNVIAELTDPDTGRVGITIDSTTYTVTGNRVSNMTLAGISLNGPEGICEGNHVKYCCTDSTLMAGTAATAGINVASGTDLSILGNTVKNCGFTGSTYVAGIALQNQTITDVLIDHNKIYDDQVTPTQAYCIRLSRASAIPHPSNITVSNNTLGAQLVVDSKIYIRSAVYNDFRIFNNEGWGEYNETWDPGVVAAAATATTTITSADAQVGDIVEVFFDGTYTDAGIVDRNMWRTSGYVLAAGTITVYITNLSASSDTFTDGAAPLKVRLRRQNY